MKVENNIKEVWAHVCQDERLQPYTVAVGIILVLVLGSYPFM